MTSEAVPGRRERNMIQKRGRIAAAATELFARQGYEATTTQQIADRADVSIGTVFRYAATKAEVLLMVRNGELARAVRQGLSAAEGVADTADAILAAIEPVIALSRTTRDVGLYQRELMFGSADEPYRHEGLAVVAELEEGLAGLLARPAVPDVSARNAASTLFAVIHLTILRDEAGIASTSSPDLESQVRQIVSGHRSTTGSTAGTTRGGEEQ